MHGTHYSVVVSIGLGTKRMPPRFIAFENCAEYFIITKSELPQRLERHVVPNTLFLKLRDANGNALSLTACVRLHVRFGSGHYRTDFLVVNRLAVDCVIGTNLLDGHCTGIRCINQQIALTRATISIVAARNRTP